LLVRLEKQSVCMGWVVHSAALILPLPAGNTGQFEQHHTSVTLFKKCITLLLLLLLLLECRCLWPDVTMPRPFSRHSWSARAMSCVQTGVCRWLDVCVVCVCSCVHVWLCVSVSVCCLLGTSCCLWYTGVTSDLADSCCSLLN
jgi:hypothetical protein